jgi:hypothetical protein
MPARIMGRRKIGAQRAIAIGIKSAYTRTMTQYRSPRASLARSQRKLQSAATRLRLHWRYLVRTAQTQDEREQFSRPASHDTPPARDDRAA